MRISLVLVSLLSACATTPPPAPPEAKPLAPATMPEVAPPLAPPVTSPKEAPEANQPTPAPTTRITRDATLVSIARIDQPCPWAEYSPDWKGLRLRSDREGCAPLELAASSAVARELFEGLAKELGAEFQPQSFGMNDYPELYARIAKAAASSPAWNAATGKPKQGSVNTFVVALAADPAAFYPEIVALLATLKLAPQLSSVEKVLVGKASETPFAASLGAAGVKDTARVPYGSIVWFRLGEL
jgi:hypothetical protein